jgi:hypothetical protein
VNAPTAWGRILEYAAGKAAKPSLAEASQVLQDVLEAMPLSRCTYRSEVLSAVLRRPPLKIPAVGFGFRGAGNSYQTSSAVPLAGFRSDDLVTIRHAGGSKNGELDWSHKHGAARSAEGELLVSLGAGDWVSYDIEIREPAWLDMLVTSQPAPPALDISVDDTSLDVEDAGYGTVRAVTNGPLSAGSHVVRLTGLAPETLVRSIEITRAIR